MFFDVKLAETTSERDVRLIYEWRNSRGFVREQKLEGLLLNFQGAIYQATSQYFGAPLPRAVLELEAKRIAVEAMTDWLATAGMKPSSFIQTRIRQRLFRYVAEHQNVGRLPEAQVQRIGDFQMAVSDLSHRFGREPSTAELADHLSLPARQVTRLRKSLRPDILSSTEGMEDLEQLTTDADYQTAMLAYYSLNDQEKIVFDNTLGAHGCPKLKAGEIAAKLHVSPSRVSAIRESLAGKIR